MVATGPLFYTYFRACCTVVHDSKYERTSYCLVPYPWMSFAGGRLGKEATATRVVTYFSIVPTAFHTPEDCWFMTESCWCAPQQDLPLPCNRVVFESLRWECSSWELATEDATEENEQQGKDWRQW